MTNANPLIVLRNSAVLWVGAAIVMIAASWWVSSYFASKGADNVATMLNLKNTIHLMYEEGVITDKNWDELGTEEKKTERWNTMLSLNPELAKIAGQWSPTYLAHVNIVKNISQKIGEGDYITWLKKSWTEEEEKQLADIEWSLAEVIPIFAGISEMESTENISGKITLKSLLNYIETSLVERFHLGNATGPIGIADVKFLEDAPEVGVYEVPLKFENVDNTNILAFLDFLGKTGGVTVTKVGKTITLAQNTTTTFKPATASESGLGNLLVTVDSLTISPSSETGGNAAIKKNIDTETTESWNLSVTLQFYIRGASPDHIQRLDELISGLLDKNNEPDSLITQGNSLLRTCDDCQQTAEISDIVKLLLEARTAYDSILAQEKSAKATFTPLQILSHRTDLMTTISTLRKKLERLASLISTS